MRLKLEINLKCMRASLTEYVCACWVFRVRDLLSPSFTRSKEKDVSYAHLVIHHVKQAVAREQNELIILRQLDLRHGWWTYGHREKDCPSVNDSDTSLQIRK